MGTFTTRLEVGNLLGNRFEVVDPIVDTGAIYTFVPRDILVRLDVEQREIRQFALADERIVEYGLGYATLRFEEREVIAPLVFAPEGTMPLLGVTTLEIAGLGVDPVNERLIPVMGLLKPARDVPMQLPSISRKYIIIARSGSSHLDTSVSTSAFSRGPHLNGPANHEMKGRGYGPGT